MVRDSSVKNYRKFLQLLFYYYVLLLLKMFVKLNSKLNVTENLISSVK